MHRGMAENRGASALLTELAQCGNLSSHDGQLGLGTGQVDVALGVLDGLFGRRAGLVGLSSSRSLPRMAVSDRTVTQFGSTSRMPPATNTNSSPPSAVSMRTEPGLIRVMSGVWPGRIPSSPASPGRATNLASPEKIDSSALTTST